MWYCGFHQLCGCFLFLDGWLFVGRKYSIHILELLKKFSTEVVCFFSIPRHVPVKVPSQRAPSSVSFALLCAVSFIDGADMTGGRMQAKACLFFFFLSSGSWNPHNNNYYYFYFHSHISKRHHLFIIICFSHRGEKSAFSGFSHLTFQTFMKYQVPTMLSVWNLLLQFYLPGLIMSVLHHAFCCLFLWKSPNAAPDTH